MDWQKERQEFFTYLQKETGTDIQSYYERWLFSRGCFWALSVDQIIVASCQALGVRKEDIVSDSVKRPLADARKIICHHLKPKLGVKLIGSELGYADHSSVVVAQQEYHKLYESDRAFKEKADKVIVDLYNLT